MKVNVISDTIQEFNGERFYLCGNYYSNQERDGEKRLHRIVYDYHNGAIPDGLQVHHKDHDRSNNDNDNLELMTHAEHRAHHADDEGFREQSRANLAKFSHLAKKWHGSEAGRDWHKEHYEATKHKLHTKELKTCSQCGTEYEGAKRKGDLSFCGRNCKAAHRRASGVDDIQRLCACGERFTINKYKPTKRCKKCRGEKAKIIIHF